MVLAREQKPKGACRSDITMRGGPPCLNSFVPAFIRSFILPTVVGEGGLGPSSQLLEDSRLTLSVASAPPSFSFETGAALAGLQCSFPLLSLPQGLSAARLPPSPSRPGEQQPLTQGPSFCARDGNSNPHPGESREPNGHRKVLLSPQTVRPSSFFLRPCSLQSKNAPVLGSPASAQPASWRFSGMALGDSWSFHPSLLGVSTCGPGTQNWGGLGVKMRKKIKIHLYFY